jgi:hypothetical protein
MKQKQLPIELCECGNNEMRIIRSMEVFDRQNGIGYEIGQCTLCNTIHKIYWKWEKTILLKEKDSG